MSINIILYASILFFLSEFILAIAKRSKRNETKIKKEFTVDVAVTKNHKLKMDGMYRHLRHPGYSGLLLTCFGLSLAMNSLISTAVITLPIALVLIYRIKVEEDILMNEFGEQYINYMRKTRKIFPGVY